MSDSIAILERLIAFPTVSHRSNLAMINFIRQTLEECGVACQIIADESGQKANLYATIGPTDRPGVMLSGHTDVVPVEGQGWTRDPFNLSETDGLLYGRGSTDMKGFIACALNAARRASSMQLKTPLHLAFSYDEEIGCVGVRHLIEVLAEAPVKPKFCLIGEPTLLQVATAHKGKVAMRAICRGVECHSAMAPLGLNAIHLAADLMAEIRALQADIEKSGTRDGDYDVPYTTLHAGFISGGTALNIVPNLCTLDFEIRNLAADDPETLLAQIVSRADNLVDQARAG
ncbi:MAG TPA: acetylornithine deacetylase, partial [Rhodospirillales bacterium]|nr:acetylornithine deacetylase [Rhodospirillales bacterium]